MREPEFAESILAEGRADFVAVGRGLIADPEWPAKAAAGDVDNIRKCISCNEGCIRRRVFMDLPVKCAINAEVGRPRTARACQVTDEPKRVLVVGGGPGGMEAARVLKTRGHHVTLWEKSGQLGGQVLLASVPSFKRKLRYLVDYLTHQIDRLGIAVELERKADLDNIGEFAPEAVILATGAGPVLPVIPGLDSSVLKPITELLREDYSGSGSRITVMGGGVKGAELALFLAQCGEEVTVVEMADQIACDIEPISRQDLLARLTSQKVRILTKTRVMSCSNDGLEVESTPGGRLFIEADAAVPCLGYRPHNELIEKLRYEPFPVYAIGDCVRPRMIMQAIAEAYEAASQV